MFIRNILDLVKFLLDLWWVSRYLCLLELIEKLPDSAIKEMGGKFFEEKTEFWDPSVDETTGAGEKAAS